MQHWLDPSKRVSQQIKGVSPITLYLGVKFYAADPCRLVEEITRYQFFLQAGIVSSCPPFHLLSSPPAPSPPASSHHHVTQVKLDILQGRLPVPPELATELAALALQCESHTWLAVVSPGLLPASLVDQIRWVI